MQPTDPLFVWLVISLAVVVFCATAFLVPRLWKKGVLKYVVQGFSVLVTIILVVLASAVFLNSQSNWFPSWSSFTGNPSEEPVSEQSYGADTSGHQAAHIHRVTSGRPSPLQENIQTNPIFASHIPADTSRGAYMTVSVEGQASGETHDVLTWLPASYFQDSHRFYPVIVAFPGFPGSLSTYQDDLHIDQRINDAVAAGDMQDAIVVIPDVMHGNNDSECVDGTQGSKNSPAPRTETFIAQDLTGWVQQNLRTINKPSAWATSGYSAGGWCSSMIALRHADIFGASLNQSGYFEPIYSDGQQWNDQNDSRYLLADRVKADKPATNVYFFASEDDPLAMDSLPAFVSAVEKPTSLVVQTIPIGGHRPDIWVIGINLGLKHLGNDLKYFAPIT